jgi:Gpi18-like mannosyltransferase
MALVFVGLFVLMTLGGIIMAYLNNMPINYEEQLAEGFYYAAIGFAVYHIFTRNKQIREAKAREQEDAAANGDGNEGEPAALDGDGSGAETESAQKP